jgi:hypothetical protein
LRPLGPRVVATALASVSTPARSDARPSTPNLSSWKICQQTNFSPCHAGRLHRNSTEASRKRFIIKAKPSPISCLPCEHKTAAAEHQTLMSATGQRAVSATPSEKVERAASQRLRGNTAAKQTEYTAGRENQSRKKQSQGALDKQSVADSMEERYKRKGDRRCRPRRTKLLEAEFFWTEN